MTRILVVDDQKDDIRAMSDILQREGYTVTAAESGHEALMSLKKHEPDMILLDILMPGLSGYDLIKQFREKLDWRIPMLFVSIISKKEALLDNSDGFIQKPFSPESFLSGVAHGFSAFKNRGKK